MATLTWLFNPFFFFMPSSCSTRDKRNTSPVSHYRRDTLPVIAKSEHLEHGQKAMWHLFALTGIPKSRGSPHQAQEKRRWQQTQHHVQLAGHSATLPEASVPAPKCVKCVDFELEVYKHVQRTCIVQSTQSKHAVCFTVLLFILFSSIFAL